MPRTALMSPAETTAAPVKMLNSGPGLGLGTTAQLVPFQCSIRVPLPLSPTAHTSLLDTAAAPSSSAWGPVPLGLGMMLQVVPFQCSVSVWKTPLPFWDAPTARTSLAATTVTPSRRLFCVLALGLGTTIHLRPF